MNTYTPYSSVVETFTLPSPPDSGTLLATIYYDFGDVVAGPLTPTLVSGTTYSVSLNDEIMGAFGKYRIKWSCTFSGTTFYAYSEFQIEDTYVKYDTFFSNYPELDIPEYNARFANVEKMARRIVDTYCGQNFQFIKNKTRVYDGNGREMLSLGSRLNSFSSVFIDQSDFTDRCSIDLKTKYFIRLNTSYPYFDSRRDDVYRDKFPRYTLVTVTGDWGWMSVPWEVEQAVELLMIDLLDDTRREHYRYGIVRSDQGGNRLMMDKGIFNSTGNVDVDTLLMDYVYWIMDYA